MYYNHHYQSVLYTYPLYFTPVPVLKNKSKIHF